MMMGVFLTFTCLSLISAVVAANDHLNFIGRFAESSANWPSSGVRFNIVSLNTTSTVMVNINNCVDDCKMYVDAIVDCVVVQNMEVSAATPYVSLKLSTVIGETYEIFLKKVTEASNGDARGNFDVGDVLLEGAEFNSKSVGAIAPKHHNCLHRHKMLVIGDSITAAYGVDGTSPCSFTAATENSDHSYATIVASAVQAELHIVAWSGKGVVRNYGDANQMSETPMPDYYNRTIATTPVSSSVSDPNYWDPARFPADIVLVMLGTNDYSTQPAPSDAQFTTGLVDFLARIIADYPDAKGRIGAMCAPLAAGPQCANIQQAAQQAGVNYVFIDPDTLSGGYGCDYHPNAATQQNIANVVVPAVKSWLQEQ